MDAEERGGTTGSVGRPRRDTESGVWRGVLRLLSQGLATVMNSRLQAYLFLFFFLSPSISPFTEVFTAEAKGGEDLLGGDSEEEEARFDRRW